MDKTIQFHIQFQVLQYTFMLMLETKIWYSIAYVRMLNAIIFAIYFVLYAHFPCKIGWHKFFFRICILKYDFSLCIKTYHCNFPTRQSLHVVIDIYWSLQRIIETLCDCHLSYTHHWSLRQYFNFFHLLCLADVFCSQPQANHYENRILIWTEPNLRIFFFVSVEISNSNINYSSYQPKIYENYFKFRMEIMDVWKQHEDSNFYTTNFIRLKYLFQIVV